MKHGIYYAYWESEWAADYKYYVEKSSQTWNLIFWKSV